MKSIISLLFLFASLQAQAQAYKSGATKCYGFPRVESLKTPSGVCVGMVADKSVVPWNFPRKIISHENSLIVSAFGGWKKNNGQVWKLKINRGSVEQKLLFNKTDRTHGLRIGPDQRIYFGDATRIIRYNPNNPSEKPEVVITGLPDSYQIPRGKLIESNHPLSEFIFLPQGHLIVNVGAPSNDCSEEFKLSKSCAQRDSQALLRIYYYDSTTQKFDPNFQILAKGLRNSMGLIFNEATDEIFQAENASDAPGTPDEINVINFDQFSKGKTFDFGWPFCSGDGQRYPGYENFKTFCASKADRPLMLLPPHAAPLDMLVYKGRMFPSLQGKILMSWHGHRPSGSRISINDTNQFGQMRVSTQPQFLIDGWQEDAKGRHPKGRPVGLAVNEDGALFVIDDQNHTLLVVASTDEDINQDQQSETDQVSKEDLGRIFNSNQLNQWDQMYAGLIQTKSCSQCHSDVIDDNDSRKTLAQMINIRWIKPGQKLGVSSQILWRRMTGESGDRIMPPSPAANIMDGKDKHNSLYAQLQNWLKGI